MKLAWIEDGRIRDTCQGDPFELYHPSIATHYYVEVPDDAANGDGWANGKLVKPEPAPPAPPPPRQWTTTDFRNGMSLAEKVKWDNDSAPEVVTVKAELPKEEAGAQELVDFLVASGVISQASATKIME